MEDSRSGAQVDGVRLQGAAYFLPHLRVRLPWQQTIWLAVDGIGLVQFGGSTPADEAREMAEIRKADTGVKKHGIKTTVLSNIASCMEGGEDYRDFPVPGRTPGSSGSKKQRVGKKLSAS